MDKVTVKHVDHAFGIHMVTIEVGSSFSIPLHPQEQEQLLYGYHSGSTTEILDETGQLWIVEVLCASNSHPKESLRFTSIDKSLTVDVGVDELFQEA